MKENVCGSKMLIEPNGYNFEIMLHTLKYATRQLVAELDFDRFTFKALDTMADFSQSRQLSLLLLDAENRTVRVIGALVDGEFSSPQSIMPLNEMPLKDVFNSRRPGVFGILGDCPYPLPSYEDSTKETKCICLPLVGSKNEVIGFINIVQPQQRDLVGFQGEILTLLTTLIASSLENVLLFRLATVDGLTGLYVRRYFEIRLQEEVARLRREDGHLAIIITDIDHFKRLNDVYGHQQGDIVLQELAKILKNSLRKDLDIPCRYGGEEYIIILPSTDLKGAVELADRLRKRCEEYAFPGQDGPLHVTISGGVAAINSDNIIPKEQLIKNADSKLYEAKSSGRNRICY